MASSSRAFPPTRAPRLLGAAAAVALALTAPGCWSRLTTPKESFLYSSGKTEGAAPVFTAPEYTEELEKLEATKGPESYRMIVGARVSVEVYGHGVRETVNVRPDGMLDLPLIGDVKAEGRTIPELKQEIANLYQPFFQQKPQIIVNTDRDSEFTTTGIRAGEVSIFNPKVSAGSGISSGAGVVTIRGDEHISQVLATVNGLSTGTEWRQIAIIRRSRDKKDAAIILCDMERLIKLGDIRQDLLVRNGDIVFIPIERATVIQEIWNTFRLVSELAGNANTITDYVERIERY